MRVADQVVLVTGGASGIGLEFARHVASRGARVWAVDRDPAAMAAATAAIDSALSVRFREGDVGDEASVARLVGEIEQESGGITILVNNAAILRDQSLVAKLGGRIKTHSVADWHETLRSNLTGTFLMARAVAATLIAARRRGLIVNISSISRAGNPGQSAYAATKAGIDALTVTWSQELAPYGIRVAAIAPGFVETPMTQRIPPLFLERIRERTPIKRFGTLEEFGLTLQFVIENDYVNGRTVEVDGGLRF